MTCKDCVHVDVCEEWHEQEMQRACYYGEYFKNKEDFVEVTHGEWIYKPSSDTLGGTDATYDWMCSVCEDTSVDNTKFCPNCGTKMDGGKGE